MTKSEIVSNYALTREECEKRAMHDYKTHLGMVLKTHSICGFIGEDSDCVTCNPPILVRVTKTDNDSILHWNDDWLDPYWEVELVEGDIGQLRSIWLDGPSINRRTGEIVWQGVEKAGVVLPKWLRWLQPTPNKV